MRKDTKRFHPRQQLLVLFILTFAVSAFGQTLNPGFETGTAPWVFYTNGSGTFNNDAAGNGSAKAGHITISLPGTNVQLYQAGLALEPNTRYTLSFKAYSNTGHDLQANVLKHASPYTNYGLNSFTFDLGTSWQSYSVEFTTSGFAGTANDGRLMFWFAPYDAAGDQYYFDDVVLEKAVSTPVAPGITTQPVNQAVTVGQTATFSVVATGTAPLTYQWQKNSVDIPGATSATYTTPATVLGDSGAAFRCIVTNAYGTATSSAATLTVTPGTAVNSVSNPGFETGTVPWVFYTNGSGTFKNNAAGDGSAKAGHITISLPGTNIQLYQAGLTLEPNTQYTLSFKAYSNTGHDLSVSLHKHGSPYTAYGLSDRVFNLTTSWSTFTVTFTTGGFAGTVNDGRLRFWLASYAAAGDQYFIDDVVLSSAAPTAPPVIKDHPANQLVSAGLKATFSVNATGATSYQWQKNGVNITGATLSAYTTPATTLADNGATYQCVVSNTLGSVTSNAATLTVVPVSSSPPSITSHPSPRAVTVGQTATFSVGATGTGPLGYQWQKNGVNITGATLSAYTTPATTLADNGASYRCVVSNAAGSATSNAATLTVTTTPPPGNEPPPPSAYPNQQLVYIDRAFDHTMSYSPALLGETPYNANCIYVYGIWYPIQNPVIPVAVPAPAGAGDPVCNHEAFKFFQLPSWTPGSWTSPVNYSQGTLHQRIIVESKPNTWITAKYASCLFQDQVLAERHACANTIPFTGPGTYYGSQAMTSLYQYYGNNYSANYTGPAVYWDREPHVIMVHMTDANNHQPDSYPGFMNLWIGTPDWSLYYPTRVRYTAIIVPPGGGNPIWPQ